MSIIDLEKSPWNAKDWIKFCVDGWGGDSMICSVHQVKSGETFKTEGFLRFKAGLGNIEKVEDGYRFVDCDLDTVAIARIPKDKTMADCREVFVCMDDDTIIDVIGSEAFKKIFRKQGG